MILLFHRVKDAAVLLGMAGAVLVTSASPQIRVAGFAAWVVGNCCWISVGQAVRDRHLVLQFVFYLVTAGIGLWTADLNFSLIFVEIDKII